MVFHPSMQTYNFVISLPDKLLIMSGATYAEESKHVEIVNSDFSPSHCKETRLNFLPRNKAFGGQIGENNIICGGRYSPDEEVYDTCFSISNDGEVFSTLQVAKHSAASVIWNNTLYINGGSIPKGRGSIAVNSTEIIVQNSNLITKDLLRPLSGHCAVLLNTKKIMIIGGRDLKDYQNKTYFVDPNENFTSTDGPSMTNERSYHACSSTVFKHEDYVMVVGGYPTKSANKTELYRGSYNNWTECKLLSFHFLR